MVMPRRELRRALILVLLLTGSAMCGVPRGLAKALKQTKSDAVTVYKAGTDVQAPTLEPTAFKTLECDDPVSGEIRVGTVVDASGITRNTMLLQALGNDLDSLALNIVAADRFRPGNKDGNLVAVAQTVTLQVDACVITSQDESGKKAARLQLRSQPEQHFGDEDVYPSSVIFQVDIPVESGQQKPRLYRVDGDVSAPVALIPFSTIQIGTGKKIKFEGTGLISMVVGANGMPQDVRVIRPVGMGLDQKAIDAMQRARFRPALLKGKQPVPVMIDVEVKFRLYE